MSIWKKWGLTPIINASGAVTRLGGAPMPDEVVDAFMQAATESVPLDQVQGLASSVIMEVTGAEAGIVTSGAAAALTLGTAAILARYDLKRMEQLPHTEAFPNEFIIAREHRNGYDHAVRAAGAKFVEVGFNEIVAGSGVRRTEAWEYEGSIGENTAGIFYVEDPHTRPKIDDVIEIAKKHKLPVLVDAAGELPPRDNLRRLVSTGADLVAFSGGKAIRGPQGTGILCGRRDLIASAALQMLDTDDHFELWDPPTNLIDKRRVPGLPRQGIGRGFKVSKEEILAVLTALKLFVSGRYDQEVLKKQALLAHLKEMLANHPVECHIHVSRDGETLPLLEIKLDASRCKRSAMEVCRQLRNGNPPIYVGHGRLAEGILMINPMHLDETNTAQLAQRLGEVLELR